MNTNTELEKIVKSLAILGQAILRDCDKCDSRKVMWDGFCANCNRYTAEESDTYKDWTRAMAKLESSKRMVSFR